MAIEDNLDRENDVPGVPDPSSVEAIACDGAFQLSPETAAAAIEARHAARRRTWQRQFGLRSVAFRHRHRPFGKIADIRR